MGEDARLFGQDTGRRQPLGRDDRSHGVLGLVLNDATTSARRRREPALASSARDGFAAARRAAERLLAAHDSRRRHAVPPRRPNVWPFLKKTLLPVWYFDRPWNGPADTGPTVGPGRRTTAASSSASRARFAGSEGTASSTTEITDLDPASAQRRARDRRAPLADLAGRRSRHERRVSRHSSARARQPSPSVMTSVCGVAQHVGRDRSAVRHELLARRTRAGCSSRRRRCSRPPREVKRGEAARLRDRRAATTSS